MIDITIAPWISAVAWALGAVWWAVCFAGSLALMSLGIKEKDIFAVLLGIAGMFITGTLNIVWATASLVHLGWVMWAL